MAGRVIAVWGPGGAPGRTTLATALARQVVEEGRWIDEGSSLIPLYYAFIGQELANALENAGRGAEASEVMTLARQVVEAVQQ